MLQHEKLYSAEEFFEIAASPENDERRLELDEGVIVEMAESKPLNSVTAARVSYFLNSFIIPRDLGYVTGADGGFKLGARKVRQPDAAFIAKARVTSLTGRFTVAPDLAVEVVSPDEDVFKKVREYIEAGTRLVWAIYSEDRLVNIFQPSGENMLQVRTLTEADLLNGGEVLPGFTLAVKEIFP